MAAACIVINERYELERQSIAHGGMGEFRRSDLQCAQDKARSLARQSRFGQAAKMLAAAAAPACRVLGEFDPEVVYARFELANVLLTVGTI
jgi:eukaryotic-like serine/threonine-protein kinase